LFLFLLGVTVMFVLGLGPMRIGSVVLDVHTMLFGGLIAMLGTQAVSFALVAKQFGVNQGILPADLLFERFQAFMTLEKMLVVGTVLILAGFFGFLWAFYLWISAHFGPLNYSIVMRWIIPSVTFIASGFQIIITSFLMGIIDIKKIERE